MQVRGNCRERFKHKEPFLNPVMWYAQPWLVDDRLTVKQQVEVECAGAPAHFIAAIASVGVFDRVECIKEGAGREAGLHDARRVEVWTLRHWTKRWCLDNG